MNLEKINIAKKKGLIMELYTQQPPIVYFLGSLVVSLFFIAAYLERKERKEKIDNE